MEYFKINGKRRLTHIAFWVYHAPLYAMHKLGLLSQDAVRTPWAANLSWFFRGYTVEEAKVIWDWIVEVYLADEWQEDVIGALRQHKANGDVVAIVSAGPFPLVARIAQAVGADHVVATRHEIKDGHYTGRVEGEVCIGANKPRFAIAKMEGLGLEIDYAASYAYGDSPGDEVLFNLVGNPVAVYPDDILRPIAERESWQILE
jgi:HAD superfamily hydrolase (TIGR01490 family)